MKKDSTRRVKIILTLMIVAFSDRFVKADSLVERARQINTLEKEGKLARALGAVTELIEELRRRGVQNDVVARALDRKASLEQDLQQYREAERDYVESIRLWKLGTNVESVGLATELNNLASLFSAVGERKKSEALQRESLEMRRRLLGEDDPEVALSYANLGVDLYQQGRYEESAGLCRQAIAIWEKGDAEHNQSDLALNTLALIELRDGRFATAVSYAQAALAQYRGRSDIKAARLASYRQTVALAREANGELDTAETEFKGALAALGGNEPSLVRIGLLRDYGQLLKRLKRVKEAKRVLHEAEVEWNSLANANEWQQTVDVKAMLPKQ